MRPVLLALALLPALSDAARADTVTDSLDAARAAYEAGDVTGALAALATATRAMQDMRGPRWRPCFPRRPKAVRAASPPT